MLKKLKYVFLVVGYCTEISLRNIIVRQGMYKFNRNLDFVRIIYFFDFIND